MSALPTIDRFSELQLIGSGGFSRVYSARQDEFDRRVAIKVLKFRLESEAERATFEAECRAMAQLSEHPHIVPLYSTTYSDDGFPAIVMQLFSGGTLNTYANGDPELALDAGVKLASALHFAHQHGVIHRDVKPKNILLSQFGEPALTDFGISAITDRTSAEKSTGITLAYAPPEALNGVADERSDIYSLAASLYAVLAGRHPHQGDSQDRTELARKILYEDPLPLAGAGLNSRFNAIIVRKGLAKEPNDRPADAAAFAEALRDLQRTEGMEITPFASSASIAAPAAPGRPPAEEDSDPSVTIVRSNRGRSREPEDAAERQLTARHLVAAGAGAMAIGLLALFLIFGRGGAADRPVLQDPETISEPADPDVDLYQAQLFAPRDVNLSRQFDGSVIVTWADPNTADVVFELQRVDQAFRSEPPVQVEGTSYVIEGVAETEVPCIIMRAVGSAGALSRDTETPACVDSNVGSGLTISLVPRACEPGACSFRIDASGLLPNSSVSILVEGPDGQDLNSVFGGIYEPTAEVDSRSTVDWRFSPQSQAPTGQYRVVVTDDLSRQQSVGFFEIVES